jgi:KamA family protein
MTRSESPAAVEAEAVGAEPVPRLKLYDARRIGDVPKVRRALSSGELFDLRVVSSVLPFRTNNYVIEELIDWGAVPDDPIFRLTFARRGMLPEDLHASIAALIRAGAPAARLQAAARAAQRSLNPHPGGQTSDNVAWLDGAPVSGLQHKYRETCLVFPSHGQTCHAYCAYCFRWPQFVGDRDLRIATTEASRFTDYLRAHPEVTDVLITGGDPMMMGASVLARYVEPLLDPSLEHIQSIRIGTKSLSYWPYRFVTDTDADSVLGLFERVALAGKHLAVMAHFSHWRELEPPVVEAAVRRIRAAGAEIRSQAPIVRRVNDEPEVWARMWREQIRLGCIPYYMFIARETGANEYFAVPLAEAARTFAAAYRRVSGLARTVRGPCMATDSGKVVVEGDARIAGERVMVLSFVQARDPDWCRRPFLARYDARATWLDQLEPALGEAPFPVFRGNES